MHPDIDLGQVDVFASGLDHPGALAFDSRGDLWTASEAGQIFRISPERRITPVANLGTYIAGLAFSPSDELFVCAPSMGIVRIAPDGEASEFATKVGEARIPGAHNGAFDAAGNLFVAASGQWQKGNGALLRFRPDGAGEVLVGDLGFVNGLAFSGDGTLFVVESDKNRILRFDISAEGALSNQQVWAESCGRFPCSVVVDSEKSVFVSCSASDEVWRIDMSGNRTLVACDPWSLKLSSPAGLAFGGPEMDQLYVCNMGRTHIGRLNAGRKGRAMPNQRMTRKVRPRPMPL